MQSVLKGGREPLPWGWVLEEHLSLQDSTRCLRNAVGLCTKAAISYHLNSKWPCAVIRKRRRSSRSALHRKIKYFWVCFIFIFLFFSLSFFPFFSDSFPHRPGKSLSKAGSNNASNRASKHRGQALHVAQNGVEAVQMKRKTRGCHKTSQTRYATHTYSPSGIQLALFNGQSHGAMGGWIDIDEYRW